MSCRSIRLRELVPIRLPVVPDNGLKLRNTQDYFNLRFGVWNVCFYCMRHIHVECMSYAENEVVVNSD
jgi:hypothetical protein